MKSIWAGLLCLLIVTLPAKASDLTMASIDSLKEQEIARIVVPQLFARIPVSISVQPLPANRALVDAISGRVDGEIMRIHSYGENNRNVERVMTPYYQLRTAAFIRVDSDIKIRSTYNLSNYKVGKVAGVQHTIDITKGLVRVYDSPNTAKLFQDLAAGKIDVALTNLADGMPYVQKNTKENGIVVAHSNLATHNLYVYLNKKHQDIGLQLNRVITELKRTGELSQMVQQAEELVYIAD
ncbi:substrate-binding periplasmic protein [Thalassotalea euphylliae]|uniref:substrate-binding periplasmic protein n=1 Tax=Thalassotalea euphylliae TaxID=1655234 RepID=UPI00363AF036